MFAYRAIPFFRSTKSSCLPSLANIPLQSCHDQICSKFSSRNFHITIPKRLNALFSEDEQKTITHFINNAAAQQTKLPNKLKNLNKVIENLPKNGPLVNLNDLLEKFNLSTPVAVNVCYGILKVVENPVEEAPKKVKKPHLKLDRKVRGLKTSVIPELEDSKSITKFCAVTIGENIASYALLEKHESCWQSQKLIDWNGVELRNLSLTESVLKLWRSLPSDQVFVVYHLHTVGRRLSSQDNLYGAAVSVMCAKNDFSDDNQRIFHITGRVPARQFNLVIGNEVVSPQPMISRLIEGIPATTIDDHIFSRSLSEITFSDNITVKFNHFDVNMKESVCQSLLVDLILRRKLKMLCLYSLHSLSAYESFKHCVNPTTVS